MGRYFIKGGIFLGLMVVAVLSAWYYGVVSVESNFFPYSYIQAARYAQGLKEFDATPDTLQEWRRISDAEFEVKGLPAYVEDKSYYRLVSSFMQGAREKVAQKGRHPSGGRAVFQTDANYLRVRAIIADTDVMWHMTGIMKNGFDVYVDDKYAGSVFPRGSNLMDRTIFLGNKTGMKNIEVYFPLYETLDRFSLYVSVDAEVRKNLENPRKKRAVYYGSSITQGCCASNPGMSYPAVVERRIGLDFVNLGFDGSGLGDLDIAEYIGTLKPEIVILDFWANPSVEEYEKKFPPFFDLVRARLPDAEIYVLDPFYDPDRIEENKKKRLSSKSYVEKKREEGDDKVFFVSDLLKENESEGLIDGLHPNAYGFYLIGTRLAAAIGR